MKLRRSLTTRNQSYVVACAREANSIKCPLNACAENHYFHCPLSASSNISRSNRSRSYL